MSQNKEILDLGSGFFTITDIAHILKIDRNKVSYLVRNYWKDRLSKRADYKYLFETDKVLALNFFALIEIKIFNVLRQNGVGYKKALKAHEFLSKKFKTPYPFAHHSFYQSGGDILFEHGNDFIQAEDTQQIAIRGIIEPFSEKIEYSSDNIAQAYYPLGKDRKIVVDPDHQFGEPVLLNTNILASTVYKMYKAGDSVNLISKSYNLDEHSINDAISFFETAA
jgi:uncharacterized protein (DUF433 family)